MYEWEEKLKKQSRPKRSLSPPNEAWKYVASEQYQAYFDSDAPALMDFETFVKHDNIIKAYNESVGKKSYSKIQITAADFETIDGYPVQVSKAWYQKRKQNGKTVVDLHSDASEYTGERLSFVDILDYLVMKGGRHSIHTYEDGTKEYRWSMAIIEWFNFKYDQAAWMKCLPNIKIWEAYTEGETTVHFKDRKPTDNEHDKDFTANIKLIYGKWLLIELEGYTVKKEIRTGWKETEEGKKEAVYETKECKVKQSLECYDIMQFYRSSLNNAAKSHLGLSKVENLPNGEPLEIWRLNESFIPEYDDPQWIGWIYGEQSEETTYGEYYADTITHYAKEDAVLTLKLANKAREDYMKTGIPFRKPFSSANVGQRFTLMLGFTQTTNILMDENNPNQGKFKKIMDSAYNAFYGGIFDCASIGYHRNVRVFDIVSSYPSNMIWLPEIITAWMEKITYKDKYGKMKTKWERKEKINGVIVNTANEKSWLSWIDQREIMDIGFVKCRFKFKDELKWNPCNMRIKGVLSSPQNFEGWITAPEWIEAIQYPHTEYEFLEASFHIPNNKKKRVYPYQEVLKVLYDIKENAPKDSPERRVAKEGINGQFGKTSQEINEIGKMWNKCYASMITGMGRARMLEFNRLCNFNAILMATDGMIVYADDVPETLPKWGHNEGWGTLGEWEEDSKYYADGYEYECVILGSGVYSWRTVEKVDLGTVEVFTYTMQETLSHGKTTTRGSSSLFLRQSKHDNWFDFLKEHSDKSELHTTTNKPASIKMTGIRNKTEAIAYNGETEWFNIMDLEWDETTVKCLPDYEKALVFNEEPYSLTTYMDSYKRQMPDVPETFGELLTESFPCNPYGSARDILMERYKDEYALKLFNEGLF